MSGTMSAAMRKAASESQLEIMQQISSNSDLSDAEKAQLYSEMVSDNYGNNNITETYGDGTKVDVSEMTILQKTKLDGEFRTTDSSGVRFDDFGKNVKEGATKSVCGGTITYKGKGKFGETVDVANGTWESLLHDYVAFTDEQRGTIVHYEGVLGSFDYNTRDFELSYYEAKINGNVISVPVLHYKGDDTVDLIGGKANIVDGCKIHIPDGLKIGDYMFVGTNIESMPDLTECSTLESAHCMFMDCKSMVKAGPSAKVNGEVKFPPKLEDASWIFAGSGMTEFFAEIGENTMDMRCAAQDCENLGHVPGNGAENEAKCSFKMPNMSKARYLVQTYCDDMFDNSNTDVEKVVKAYTDKNEGHISQWTDVEGAHNNIYDKVNDGSYNAAKIQMIKEEAARKDLQKLVDPNGSGMTGVEAGTNGLMTSAVQLTDGGAIVDTSTWSVLRQTDKTYTEPGSGYGELFDRGVAFLGTFGLAGGILKSATHNKWIALIGGGAIAAIPQVVGVADKLSPLLDSVANFLGEGSQIGSFLKNVSDKLKDEGTSYHTPVEDLDIDEVFEEQQDASAKFAYKQMKSIMKPFEGDYEGFEGYAFGAISDATVVMRSNGENIAKDGNLITIALTSEEILCNSLNTTLMETSMSGLEDKLASDMKSNGGKLSDFDKKKYSQFYLTLMKNMSAYSDGALSTVNEKYVIDVENKEKALNGLSKVMRNSSEAMYVSMRDLQTKYKLFSDEQLKQLDKFAPYGMPKFSEYTSGMNLVPADADKYVEELETNRTSLKEQLNQAKTTQEYQDSYRKYYESSFGYLIDESESHNVNITKEKDVSGLDLPKTVDESQGYDEPSV